MRQHVRFNFPRNSLKSRFSLLAPTVPMCVQEMVLFSRPRDWLYREGTCHDYAHTWHPSCLYCAGDIFVRIFRNALKVYAPLYLVRLLNKLLTSWRHNRVLTRNFCQSGSGGGGGGGGGGGSPPTCIKCGSAFLLSACSESRLGKMRPAEMIASYPYPGLLSQLFRSRGEKLSCEKSCERRPEYEATEMIPIKLKGLPIDFLWGCSTTLPRFREDPG